MYPYLRNDISVVFVCNTAEAFFDYMNRATTDIDRQKFISDMHTLGDRGLFYPWNNKLVILSAPLFHAHLLCDRLGYTETQWATPQQTSSFLCLDILNDEPLMQRIAQQAANTQNMVQLIPHATTAPFLKLATVLQERYSLTVLLPESPPLDTIWLRDYIDTKSGFRQLFSSWFDQAAHLLPQGFICTNIQMATEVVSWFLHRHQACLVKADRGNDALGHTIFQSDQDLTTSEIFNHLQGNAFLKEDLIIVEAFIPSSQQNFPSVEFFVPSPEYGKPFFTYACNQLFLESGTFGGVLISQELQSEAWYDPFVKIGATIAQHLQSMGYVGYFDLDAIVNDAGHLVLMEVNARRTGGTHVHEVGQYLIGNDYLEQVSLISNTSASCGSICQFSELETAIAPILYPMQNQNQGVVISHSSAIANHTFGYVVLAASTAEAIALEQQMRSLLS